MQEAASKIPFQQLWCMRRVPIRTLGRQLRRRSLPFRRRQSRSHGTLYYRNRKRLSDHAQLPGYIDQSLPLHFEKRSRGGLLIQQLGAHVVIVFSGFDRLHQERERPSEIEEWF